MPRKSPITIFKWGYEGWGNATELLVKTIDTVERSRGFEPPMFVDVRRSRSVRAIGFRDRAFEEQLGEKRYVWMSALGNDAVVTRSAKMKIKRPEAAQELLDLAIDAAKTNRRIIFFCSCHSPGATWCHRHVVGDLVLRAARARGVGISLEEWPGGDVDRTPVARIRIAEAEIRKLRRGADIVPLTDQDAKKLHAAPWGALVEVVAGSESNIISAGPPFYRAGRWRLRLFVTPAAEDDEAPTLLKYVRRFRKEANLDAVRS